MEPSRPLVDGSLLAVDGRPAGGRALFQSFRGRMSTPACTAGAAWAAPVVFPGEPAYERTGHAWTPFPNLPPAPAAAEQCAVCSGPNPVSRPVLVTGGAGFIGSELVRQLVRETDRTVVNVDALTYAGTKSSVAPVADSPEHRFERVDIRNAEEVDRVFREHRPAAVVHLAAETHVDRSIDNADRFLSTNVRGTSNLLEAARRHWAEDEGDAKRFRFVHVSTDEVFGDAGERDVFNEATPYAPSSPYAASKAAADHMVRAWGRTYGLPVLVTNCTNNYGPYQFPDKLIPHMVISALHGDPLPLYGDGRQVRDWLYVGDHARALRHVLTDGEPGRTYCIGARAEREVITVVEAICVLLDGLSPRADGSSYLEQIAFVEDRPGHDRRYAMDPARIEKELGWRPSVSFEEGLKRTVRWYLEHGEWWRPLRESRYGGERLGAIQERES